MKKFLFGTIALGLLSTSLCYGADALNVTVNGENLVTDTPAQIVEGRTLVPIRAIFEALGAEVYWNGADKSITAERGATTVALKIDDATYTVNNEEKKLDVPAKIIDGRTMVPARAVSESFGCGVEWDAATKTVKIAVPKVTETKEQTTITTTEATTETTTLSYKTVYNEKEYKNPDDNITPGQYIVFSRDGVGAVSTRSKYKGGRWSDDPLSLLINDLPHDINFFGDKYEDRYSTIVFNGNAIINVAKVNADDTYVDDSNPTEKIEDSIKVELQEINLIDGYMVPSEEVEKLDLSYNGKFRVGIDIPAGNYTLNKAEGHEFGFVRYSVPYDIETPDKNKVTNVGVKTCIVKNNTSIKLDEGETIQILNCDISQGGKTIAVHKDTPDQSISGDFADITPELKDAVTKYITSLANKFENNFAFDDSDFDEKADEWEKMSKTDSDKAYVEVVRDVLRKYKEFSKNRIYSINEINDLLEYKNNDDDERGFEIEPTLNEDYYERERAIKSVAPSFVKDLKSVVEADSFETLSKASYKLNDYCFEFPVSPIVKAKIKPIVYVMR